MRKTTIIMACALLSICAAFGQDGGSTAYNYLNVTSSARIYGLGGINITTVEDDISVIDQNPALLGQEMDNQIGVNYMRYLGDSNFAGIKYARKAGKHAAWAAGIQYFGYGTIKGTDEMGNFIGDFSPKDVNFFGDFSYDITDRLRGGIALKFLYSSYEQYSALAIGTDLGINYYDPDKDMSLSVVVANLGGQVKRFHERYDRLPVDIRLGWTQSFGSLPIRFSITAWNLTKWRLPYYEVGDGTTDAKPQLKDKFSSNLFRHLILAADFIPSDKYYLSVGYNYKQRTDMATYQRNMLSGFSFGGGLNVNKFGVGVAFAQPHSGATTFMVNLRLDLNDLL